MTQDNEKIRWLSLYVENNKGLLARISNLFTSKAYNLETITAGTTEDPSITRITLSLRSNDEVFEQVKKQLVRMIDIIKVMDFTEIDTIMRELIFIKVKEYSPRDMDEVFHLAKVFNGSVVDCSETELILQAVNSEKRNNELVSVMRKYPKIEVVRGGSVAINTCHS